MAGILLLTISTTHAAGLGKLTVTSALGQPLRAEIDLVSVQKDELASLTARLASPDAFKQAELEYTAALASVKVNVEKRPNGQPYIKLTSSQPIEEPILDVLIELSWASGRLVREYTALMDPPEYNTPAVAPVARPGTQADPKPETAAKTRPSGKISRKPETVAPEAGAGDGSGESYKVKSGDTLARIARSNKVEGVSLEQMLVGLYQNNRQAFAGNMNRLKSGTILRVPDRETLVAVEPAEAVQEVKAQAANWNAYRQKLAAAAQASAPTDAAAQSATGRITATVEDRATVADPAREVLKLSKGEQNIADVNSAGNAGAGGADPRALQERLRNLEEEATAREKALQEANERLALLEGNIKSMQRLLEIRNESLAQAQNQAKVTNQPETAADSSTPAIPPAAGGTDAKAPAGAAAVSPAPAPAPDTNRADPQAGPLEGLAPAPGNVAENKAPAVAAAIPVEEPGLVSRALDEPLYLAVGALLLALIAFAVMRHRRNQPEFENSIMTGGDLTGNTVFGDSSGGVVDTSNSSLITDFGKVGLEHISTDEVDPLAEAEVYIAYGRDAQAEEILKEAANRNPQRHEIHLKLLEIYAMRQSLGAFETLAGELYAATEGQGDVWSKAAELGRSLDPDNPLYASARAAEAKAFREEETHDFIQGASLDQATRSEFDFNSDPVSNPLSQRDDGAMDFDTTIDQDREAQRKIESRDDRGMDFEVAPIEEAERPIEAAAAPDTMIDFDFDLGAPQTRAAAEDDAITLNAIEEEEPVQFPPHKEAEHKADTGMQAGETTTSAPDFDVDFSRQETEDKQAPIDRDERDRKDVPNAGVHTDLSTVDLNFDSSRTVQERAEAPVARNDQWYDVQTKFDLAKAYQEMGDKEGAREILQEVVQEGDAEQQANSKALLASLG